MPPANPAPKELAPPAAAEAAILAPTVAPA